MKSINVEEIIKERDKRITGLKEELEEINKNKTELFGETVENVKPYIEYIKRKGYYFRHPSINCISSVGPIIGVDEKKDVWLVFNPENNVVNEIEMYNPEGKKTIPVWHFIEKYDFEAAMEGLLYCKELQEIIINDFQEMIISSKKLIEKYKKRVQGT